jgi:Flp pilus assembly pilin Flp
VSEPSLSGRVDLVADVDPAARRAGRVGLGLLLSLPIGSPALLSVLQGGEGFEWALLRFLLSVAVAVGGVLFVSSLFDRFTMVAAAREAAARMRAARLSPPTGDQS